MSDESGFRKNRRTKVYGAMVLEVIVEDIDEEAAR